MKTDIARYGNSGIPTVDSNRVVAQTTAVLTCLG